MIRRPPRSTRTDTLFPYTTLFRSLGNLLENAFKWAKSPVLLTARPAEQQPNRRPGLVLAVDDDRPGIPEDRIPYVPHRAVRRDERVQGHRLGLSILPAPGRLYRRPLNCCPSLSLARSPSRLYLPPGL